jgi:hypothetical protein
MDKNIRTLRFWRVLFMSDKSVVSVAAAILR